MEEPASRLPKYLQLFGPSDGLRLAVALERAQPEDHNHRVAHRVPGFDAAVHLRNTVSDHSVFWQCLVMRQHNLDRFVHSLCLDEAYRAEMAASRSPVVADCGSNIVLSVLWLAWRFPQATIFAGEPEGDNFAVLQANTAYLGDHMQCVRGGVWPETTPLKIGNRGAGRSFFSCLGNYSYEYQLGGKSIFCFRDASV